MLGENPAQSRKAKRDDRQTSEEKERERGREGTTEATIETLRGAKSFPRPLPAARLPQGRMCQHGSPWFSRTNTNMGVKELLRRAHFPSSSLSRSLWTLKPWNPPPLASCWPLVITSHRTSRLPVSGKPRGLSQKLIINDPLACV